MSWLRVLLYYVVAAALTFHLLDAGAPMLAGETETAKPETPFLEGVPERIDRVRMESDGAAVLFGRVEGRWKVLDPPGLASPGDVVDAILESFMSLPPIEIVATGLEHQGQFGLVPPRARIRIEQGGTVVSTVVLGDLSPTRTAVYAKKSGQEDVALIGLNAKYYMDLVFENVRRQSASQGTEGTEGTQGADAPGVAD